MADHVIILTGDPGSGKTTFLAEVISLLKERISLGGMLARGAWHEGVRDNFYLEDIRSGRTMLFCQRQPADGWQRIRHFYVNPAGQEFGNLLLSEAHLGDSRLVVIDEVGPFELQGKGWAGPVERLLARKGIILLMSVRMSLITEVVRHWDITGETVFDLNRDAPSDCAGRILALAGQSL